MVEKIISIIKSKDISDFSLCDETRETAELFFIKKKLDLVREKNTREVRVTIYREFSELDKNYLGNSLIYIYPQMTDDEISAAIDDAYESALYVKNPFYKLPDGCKQELVKMETTLGDSLMDNAISMTKAFYGADHDKDAYINSAEFFATKNKVRIVTSHGCDVSYTKYGIKGEFVAQCIMNDNDVELHRQFAFDDMELDRMVEECSKALLAVKDRVKAIKAPEDLSKYPVIICDDNAGELLNFYLERTNAANISAGYSDYSKDYKVNNDLNITILPDVPYSEEGIKKSEHILIDDGIVKCIHGNVRFSEYLGIPQIGAYTKFKCDNATESLEKMISEPCIMVKCFSDFQMDEMDGYFGGEFRLAYLYDGNETKIITGGTISGNLLEAQGRMIFSTERYANSTYEGPMAIKIC